MFRQVVDTRIHNESALGPGCTGSVSTKQTCEQKAWHLSSFISKWKGLPWKNGLRPMRHIPPWNFLKPKQLPWSFLKIFLCHSKRKPIKKYQTGFMPYLMETNYKFIKVFLLCIRKKSWWVPALPTLRARSPLPALVLSNRVNKSTHSTHFVSLPIKSWNWGNILLYTNCIFPFFYSFCSKYFRSDE